MATCLTSWPYFVAEGGHQGVPDSGSLLGIIKEQSVAIPHVVRILPIFTRILSKVRSHRCTKNVLRLCCHIYTPLNQQFSHCNHLLCFSFATRCASRISVSPECPAPTASLLSPPFRPPLLWYLRGWPHSPARLLVAVGACDYDARSR